MHYIKLDNVKDKENPNYPKMNLVKTRNNNDLLDNEFNGCD